ncbi:exosortase system-associated protein, TIGR04073 family [Nitrosomonas sp. JL21]|uniref:exosortase system-associated protein, TIGR04073 family n=1 Tax=Nitrosomonas sp. JL21 TaxID=153949 RepID=UPI0031F4418C
MNRLIKIISILLILHPFASQVYASEEITANIYMHRAGTKILSGVVNVATGWMELPKNIGLWNQKDENILEGTAEGILWGLVHTASRTASGAIDLVTFWIPTFPIPEPLFVFDNFSKESEYHAFRMGR